MVKDEGILNDDKLPEYSFLKDVEEKSMNQDVINLIKKDIDRTFPNHLHFEDPEAQGKQPLFNILKAYSLIDKEVGYCQGLSFLAAALLLHVSPIYY